MYYIYIYVLKLLHHHYFDPLERDQRSCGLEREGEIGREGKGRERESVTYDCWEHLNLHQTHLKSPKTRQRETRNTTSTNFNEITGAFVDPYLHPCKERRREILQLLHPPLFSSLPSVRPYCYNFWEISLWTLRSIFLGKSFHCEVSTSQ